MSVAGNPSVSPVASGGRGIHYKWIALSNTTLGILMVTINQSILLISLPALFRGISLNPLVPSNTGYFLWVFMGFVLVTAVLVVSLGRVGDIYGRVKMYNLGFAVFTFFSIMLSITWLTGPAGALWIIIMRIFQGVGGAFLFANSTAILTDAFPQDERGKAMGINGIAAISGSFLGLIGETLCAADWRLFCPESWDDQALADPAQAARARRRRKAHPRSGAAYRKVAAGAGDAQEMTGPAVGRAGGDHRSGARARCGG